MVVDGVCKALDISMEQATDAFGEYWVSVYSQKMYKSIYEGCETAKDLLLKMDQVHVTATRKIEGARPPRFEYRWENDNTAGRSSGTPTGCCSSARVSGSRRARIPGESRR